LNAVESQREIDFSISLRMRNFSELQARIQRGEVVPRAELASKYLPDPADYAKVVDWLAASGFTMKLPDKNYTTIFARGSVAKIEEVFGVTFSRVATSDGEFTSAVTAPALPTDQGLPLEAVLAINGLQPHLRAHAKLSQSSLAQAVSQPIPGNPGFLAPVDISTAYNAPTGLTGTGQTIAIIIDAIPTSSDLNAFWTICGSSQQLSNFTVVNVAGGPTTAGALNLDLPEATLDVEWAGAIASGAAIRLYAIPSLSSNDIQTACVQILNDLPTVPTLNQVSISFGNAESQWAASSIQASAQTMAQLAAEGVTVFVASGDGGSNPNTDGTNGYNPANPLEVEYPASDPSVTGVGGTALSLNQDGSVATETAWGNSGGGISTVFTRPSWQIGSGVPAAPASGSAMRCVPDIAAVAANSGTLQSASGGMVVAQLESTFIILNGTAQSFGGTSLSCPV